MTCLRIDHTWVKILGTQASVILTMQIGLAFSKNAFVTSVPLDLASPLIVHHVISFC